MWVDVHHNEPTVGAWGSGRHRRFVVWCWRVLEGGEGARAFRSRTLRRTMAGFIMTAELVAVRRLIPNIKVICYIFKSILREIA